MEDFCLGKRKKGKRENFFLPPFLAWGTGQNSRPYFNFWVSSFPCFPSKGKIAQFLYKASFSLFFPFSWFSLFPTKIAQLQLNPKHPNPNHRKYPSPNHRNHRNHHNQPWESTPAITSFAASLPIYQDRPQREKLQTKEVSFFLTFRCWIV